MMSASENEWVLSFLRKAEEDSDSLRAKGRAFQSLGAELDCFYIWFSSTPGIRRPKKVIREIVVVNSEESALEDIVELCHWSTCTPVKESYSQYNYLQETSGGFSRQARYVFSSLSVSQLHRKQTFLHRSTFGLYPHTTADIANPSWFTRTLLLTTPVHRGSPLHSFW